MPYSQTLGPPLGAASVPQQQLAPGGRATESQTFEYFRRRVRYRDVLVAPDGQTIYAAVDARSQEHAGSILAFTYQP